MTNETKLHPAVEALKLPAGPWIPKEAWRAEYWLSSTHTNIRDKEDDHSIAIAVDDEAVPLFLASPEMLSWMVQDLSAYQSIENPPAHIQQGRELVKRASNGKINLDYTPF